MTRASLLRILDHVNGISDDEIRELEQLAAAFPYCQTAYVLLAKTAHDRGSMLAGQRLRRAATYAADRELLRQLLERSVAPTMEAAPAAPVAAMRTASTFSAAPVILATATLETDLFAVEIVSAPLLPEEAPSTSADKPATDEAPTPPGSTANALDTAASTAAAATEKLVVEHEPIVAEPAATIELSGLKVSPDTIQTASAETVAEPEIALATTFAATEAEETAEINDEKVTETAVVEEAEVPVATVASETSDEVLPATAPPIRPPGGAGISRFEFGLGESRLPEPTGYLLAGSREEEDEIDSDEDELPTFHSAASPRITAPFRADAEVGYALGGGSRLGYDLQTRTSDGFTLDLPLEAFFEPDALLLAYARAHQPVPKASSIDLINRFLKTQPRIKTPAGTPLPAAEQADLSVRSSAGAPALASESLAKIMVKQGKTAKAIEIYERLITKQPEKMAYFVDQIQQLQQPLE